MQKHRTRTEFLARPLHYVHRKWCQTISRVYTRQQQNTSWYSPTRNREFNFSGRYRSRERVRVPNKRHVRLGRSQSAPCPAPQRRHERNQEKGKLSGIKRKNLVRRGEHVTLRVWKREARRGETRTRRCCASASLVLCASVLRRRERSVRRRTLLALLSL